MNSAVAFRTELSPNKIIRSIHDSLIAQGSYYKAYRDTDMDTFIQDDYKVSSPLTLNMGLRWELNGGIRKRTFSGVTTIQTGTPLNITDAHGGSIYGFASTSRVEICPRFIYSEILTSGSISSRTNNYFNAAAFCAEPTIGNGTDYGNTGGGIVRGPWQDNFDMAIARRFGLKFREDSVSGRVFQCFEPRSILESRCGVRYSEFWGDRLRIGRFQNCASRGEV